MKILFLDCDGILNHERWYASKEYYNNAYLDPDIDPAIINRLNKLTNSRDVKIVISSSWKIDSYCIERLRRAGLDNIIDVTPNLIFIVPLEIYCRGMEINAWFEQIEERCLPEVRKYLILDDMNDFFDEQQQFFLLIDHRVGFTDDDLQYCLKYFE